MRAGARAALLSGAAPYALPLFQNYSKGSYNAYSGMFAVQGNGSYKAGVHYDAVLSINPVTFPNRSSLKWFTPPGAIPAPFGVWGYLALAHGNGNGTAEKEPVTPVRLDSIGVAETYYSVSFFGNPDFNLLSEVWLSDKPAANGAGLSAYAVAEVGFFTYTSSTAFHNGGLSLGTFTDARGVTWDVRRNTWFITAMPTPYVPRLTGYLPWKDYFQFLMKIGLLSGSEYINGVNFGIEPFGTTGARGQFDTAAFENTLTTGSTVTVNANLIVNANSTAVGWAPGSNELTRTTGYAGPDGATSAERLRETATTATHRIIEQVTGLPSKECDYWFAIDVAPDGRDWVVLQAQTSDFSANVTAKYHILNGVTPAYDAGGLFTTDITKVVALEAAQFPVDASYRRLLFKFRKKAGQTSVWLGMYVSTDGTAVSYAGDTSKGVFLRPRFRLFQDQSVGVSGTPASATQNSAYSFTVAGRGGTGTLSYALTSGTLPTGLSLNTSTGVISGTPTVIANTTGLAVTVTDSGTGATAVLSFAINVTSGVLALPSGGAYDSAGPDGTWTPTAASVVFTANADTSPAGTTTASRVRETLTNSTHVGGKTLTGVVVAAGTRNLSFYVKRQNGTRNLGVEFYQNDFSNLAAACIDLGTGAVQFQYGYGWTVTIAVDPYQTWWKVTLTFTVPTQFTGPIMNIKLFNGTVDTYTGDNASALDVWGIDLR